MGKSSVTARKKFWLNMTYRAKRLFHLYHTVVVDAERPFQMLQNYVMGALLIQTGGPVGAVVVNADWING